MSELELALTQLGHELEYPETPDLSGAVRLRLAEGRQARSWRRPLIIALAALVVAVGAVIAVPQARSEILDWLGIGAVTVRQVEGLPEAELATGDLGVGDEVSLAEARERVSFPVRVPTLAGLEDPNVYYAEPLPTGQVSFVYGSLDKPQLLITQVAALGALEKLVNTATRVELVSTEDAHGVWIEGERARPLLSGRRARGALPAGRKHAHPGAERRGHRTDRGGHLQGEGASHRSLDALTRTRNRSGAVGVERQTPEEVQMRKLLIVLSLAALALPASAIGGGWATAGVSPPPDDMGPGQTWDARITVLQHGNPETPLMGVVPTLTIKNGSTAKTFKAKSSDEPGVYIAHVVFPSSGKWSYSVYDGFTQYGGAQTHTFAPVSIGVAGDDGGFPTMTVTAVIALLLGLAAVLYLLARRLRVRAPAPTH